MVHLVVLQNWSTRTPGTIFKSSKNKKDGVVVDDDDDNDDDNDDDRGDGGHGDSPGE